MFGVFVHALECSRPVGLVQAKLLLWALTASIMVIPRFYVSTSKSIIKALINMHSFEIQLSPIG
ncbi:TPA: hypothetical protein H3L50_004447 [Escherichia coli]|nr:hypothetical protein [Escherichia coli]